VRTTLPIGQGFYVSDSLPISNQRCVNWRPNVPQTNTITDANLFPVEGIREIVTGSVLDRCRGVHLFQDVPYYVISQTLYRLNRTLIDGEYQYSLTNLGTIPGIRRVYIADNGTQMCIVAVPDIETTGKSYIFTADPDTLTEITDPNFDGPASSVVYASGYFVFHKSDGKKFFNSPLNNGLTGYDALDFNVANADPDQIRGLGVLNDELYVFGQQTTQIYRDRARVPSPFVARSGGVLDVGIDAPQTIVKFGSNLAFVGSGENESPAVWLVSGGRKQKLSTTAIDNEIAKIDLELAEQNVYSWVYSVNGAYMLGIATTNTTYVYDATNSRWHERQSIQNQELAGYRVSHILKAYGVNLVGDTLSGNIGILDEDEYLEYGTLTPRFVTTRPFDNQGEPVSVAAIEAVVENGVGLANDIQIKTGENQLGEDVFGTGGSDPKMTFAWSDDGGRIFKGFLAKSMGKIGEYKKRVVWPRLGNFSRDRVLKFEVSSPTKSVLIKAEADIG